MKKKKRLSDKEVMILNLLEELEPLHKELVEDIKTRYAYYDYLIFRLQKLGFKKNENFQLIDTFLDKREIYKTTCVKRYKMERV